MTTDKKNTKYYAFISYNSEDYKWGRILQRKLENYTPPADLRKKYGWERNPIKPVFFAPSDINLGELREELNKRLEESRNLIVIGSPNSAKSHWVGEEIEYFYSLGRKNKIHYFIVDGVPNSGNPDTECYHSKLKELNIPEILGANIHEKNVSPWPWIRKERAYVQIIAKLLGVGFNTIWQRQKRQLAEKIAMWICGTGVILAALFYAWYSSQPVDVNVKLNETSYINKELPPMKDAIITISLDNEKKTDTITSIDKECVFKNIPSKFIGKKVSFSVECQDFHSIDTAIVLGTHNTLNIRRNTAVYGYIHLRLWDAKKESAIGNAIVNIEGMETRSDGDGYIYLSVPPEKQKCSYTVTTPFNDNTYTIYMPCGDYNAILIE